MALPRTTFKQPARPERKPRAWPGLQVFAPTTRINTLELAQPKSQPHRSRRLLDMAKGKPCLMQVSGCCERGIDTTVAAHSNWQAYGGKAGARKSDDQYSVWSCWSCHSWLDQGPAKKEHKQAMFLAGHIRQVQAWRDVVVNAATPAKDKAAALLALNLLGAAP